MKTKKEKKPHGIVYKRAVPCGIMAVVMVATGIGSAAAFKSADAINIALDTVPVSLKNEGGEDAQYFTMDYDSTEELKAHDAEIAQKLTEEGCVLLKNSSSALPLSAGSRVSVFSHSSVDLEQAPVILILAERRRASNQRWKLPGYRSIQPCGSSI